MTNQQTPTPTGAPDFNKLEEEVLAFWDEHTIFEKTLEQTKDGEPYVFYDGPPFATGLPHYGHILASTVKDVFGRYYTMKGRYVRRVWGWDCHGLPIENIVEQELKISGKKQIEALGVDKFNETCRSEVLRFAHEWGKTVRRMGRWVDFENSYKTMDSTYQESVWWALKQLWDKQLVYEDRKVLLYCSRCETPISNFEVAQDNSYRDVTENSVYVKFRLLPHQRIADFIVEDNTYVVAWTTTPWTLPGNTALNIGPDIQYVLVQQGTDKLLVAKERLEVLSGEYEVISSDISARSLEGLQYEPLYKLQVESEKLKEGEGAGDAWVRAHRIYIEDYVTTTDGTGVVHNAAMYGEEDFKAAKRRGLPRVDMLDQKGHYLTIVPEFLQGMFFKNAEKPILEDLTQRNLVYRIEPFTHSYPHCHRCGTPLYYDALPAWFINIQKIKPQLLKANGDTNWYPDHLKEGRFSKSMEQAPDWNISRNRFWATALPFWKCQDSVCRNVICVGSVDELMHRSTNFKEVYPNFVASATEPKNVAPNGEVRTTGATLQSLDLHKPYIDMVVLTCDKCNGPMRRVPEVVDCWVESASMPFAELHAPFDNIELFKKRFPADFVTEYIGQTRAWFYVMHALNVALFGRAPFRNVVTTGNILAEDGSKMSKSKKNYPDPSILIERYGVDAIRFYMLSTPVMNADDLNFSEKGVKEVAQKVNMLLYNVLSFYKMYADTSSKLQVASESGLQVKHVLDVWVVNRLRQLQGAVTWQMEHYNTVKVCREIVEFVNDLSTWYVRRNRDRIKAGGEDGAKALEVLGFVLVEVSKLLAPTMPFLADHIYRSVTGLESVHLDTWPTNEQSKDERVLQQMDLVREIVSLALAARKLAKVSVRQPLRALAYQATTGVPLSAEHEKILLEELNVKVVEEFDSLSDKARVHNKLQSVPGTGIVKEVLLDLEITQELRLEGYARELERAVQDLRKKTGLSVGDRVSVYYNTQDEELEHALTTLLDKNKVGAESIAVSVEVEADNEIQADIDNRTIWLGIVKNGSL